MLFALEWLQANNPFYSNITINYRNLQRLPENDIPSQLLSIEEEEDALSHQSAESDNSDEEIHESRSFLPTPKQSGTENDMIQATIDGIDPLDWPNIDGEPINEFKTSGLATVAFPTLFPYGTSDPTCAILVLYLYMT